MKKNVLLWSFIPALLLAAAPVRAAVEERAASPVTAMSSDIEKLPQRDISEIINQLPQVRELPKQQVGVHLFYQDVHALSRGGNGTRVYAYGGSVVGLGADYTYRPRIDSGFYVRGMGGYGIGTEEIVVGGVTGYTDKVQFKAIYGSVAGGYIAQITRKAGVYGQAGVGYSTTKGTFDDGVNEEDGEPFKVFGLDTALGLRVGIGGKNSVFFEQYSQFGWGSGKQDGSEYKETVKYGCFRGGLDFGF